MSCTLLHYATGVLRLFTIQIIKPCCHTSCLGYSENNGSILRGACSEINVFFQQHDSLAHAAFPEDIKAFGKNMKCAVTSSHNTLGCSHQCFRFPTTHQPPTIPPPPNTPRHRGSQLTSVDKELKERDRKLTDKEGHDPSVRKLVR